MTTAGGAGTLGAPAARPRAMHGDAGSALGRDRSGVDRQAVRHAAPAATNPTLDGSKRGNE